MPQTQLTGFSQVIASILFAFGASAAAQTQVAGSATIPANFPGTSGQTTPYVVPGNEWWYITNFYLPAGMSVSTPNMRIFTVVNFATQRIAPSEAELQQNIYNKITFSRAQWIVLPPTQQFYFFGVNQVANVTTGTTSITLYATIATLPIRQMK